MDSPTTARQTSDPWSEHDQRVRDYILRTLAPFVPAEDGGLGRMLYSLLRRGLRQADHDDLQRVLYEAGRFVDGYRAANLETRSIADEAARHIATVPGQSPTDRPDPLGEIDLSTIPANDILAEIQESQAGMEDAPYISDRYETEMEGDANTNGEKPHENVSANGPGGHTASGSDDADE